MAYLRSLTAPSGEVRYSRTSRQTPVWVTAQALMALARRSLPLPPVPRARGNAGRAPRTAAAPRTARRSQGRAARRRPSARASRPRAGSAPSTRRAPRARTTPAPTPTPAPGAAIAAAAVAAAAVPARAHRAGIVAGLAATALL